MIVTCTACKTRYLTDPALLGPAGRTVRCAKCGHSWQQLPPADMPRRVDVVSPPPPAEQQPPRYGLPVPWQPRRRATGYRWALAAAAVIMLLAGAGWFARDHIVETWPPAMKVYDFIGSLIGSSAPAPAFARETAVVVTAADIPD